MENVVYLNVNEAAELLKIKKATLYQYVWKKKIPSYKPFGGNLYFRKDEILALINKGKMPTAEEIETKAATHLVSGGRK